MKVPGKIALLGNPNCGKSTLFNVLTGLNQKIGNYPGVTVDRKTGSMPLSRTHKATLIDLPGTYSLYPAANDENITCQVLRDPENRDHPDQIIMVADATQLKRSLLLCTMAMDLGIPVILVLNMNDLLKKQNISIDREKLSRFLGIPVVLMSAVNKTGINALRRAILGNPTRSKQSFLQIPEGFRPLLDQIKSDLATDNDYLAFQALLQPGGFPRLEPQKGKSYQDQANIESADALISNEMLVRYDRIDGILAQVVKTPAGPEESFTDKLDRILIHKVWGYVIFLGILMLIFQAIFNWAEYPMEWIDKGFASFGGWLADVLADGWLADLLVEGVVAGLGGIVIFIPQIIFLFLFISILEESGYMSRVVFLMDRIMRPFGFSGKSVIPLIGGMACAIPSIMMTRNIPNVKERLITILVTPLMSCSARIPVYILLIGMFVPATRVLGFLNQQGLVMMGLYLLGFVMALIVAWVLKRLLKYDSQEIFLVEMPIYRMPRPRNVGLTIYEKGKSFVVEAGKVIIVISIILWFLASFGPTGKFEEIDRKYDAEISAQVLSTEQVESLEHERASDKLEASFAGRMGKFIEPAIRPLGFNWKIGISLVTSFAAREVFVGTMSTIYSVGESKGNMSSLIERMRAETDPLTGKPSYTPAVAISLLIFYAFAMQCMSTLAVTLKETQSWKWTLIMLFYLTGLAYVSSLITYQLMA